MGEASRVKEATAAAAKVGHRVEMTWVERACLLWLARQGQGKGAAHAKLLRATTKQVAAGDDFDYLEGNVNLRALPGEQRLLLQPTPTIVKELVEAGVVATAREIRQVLVTTRDERDCPDRVVELEGMVVDFLLKQVEEVVAPNSVKEALADAIEHLEDAKAGRYELPGGAVVSTPPNGSGTSSEASQAG